MLGLASALGLAVSSIGGGSANLPARASASVANVRTVAKLVVSLASWHLQSAVSRTVVVGVGSKLDILGGLATGDTSTASIWSLDPTFGSSQQIGELQTAVHDAAGAAISGRALVFGGGSYSTVSSVQAWNGARTSTIGSLPVGRSDLASAVIGKTVYVLGGFDGTSLVRSILATDDGVHFRVVGSLAQPVRYPAVVGLLGKVWVIGGQLGIAESSSVGGQTSDIQRFDPATGTTSIVGHLPVTLGHASAVALSGQLFVLGGRTGLTLSSRIWHIDASTGRVLGSATMPFPRSDAAIGMIAGRAWMIGGETSGPLAPLDSALVLRVTS